MDFFLRNVFPLVDFILALILGALGLLVGIFATSKMRWTILMAGTAVVAFMSVLANMVLAMQANTESLKLLALLLLMVVLFLWFFLQVLKAVRSNHAGVTEDGK